MNPVQTQRLEEAHTKLNEARTLLMQIGILLTGLEHANAANAPFVPTAHPVRPTMKKYRGDIGKLRKALFQAGWDPTRRIFLDARQGNQHRLKIYYADDIVDASQEQQRVLRDAVEAQFGKRIVGMYVDPKATRNSYGKQTYPYYHALCVRITK